MEKNLPRPISVTRERVGEGISNQSQVCTNGKMLASHSQLQPYITQKSQ